MKTLKAQFKDDAGYYTMTWSYNPELWEAKDLISHECKKCKSKFIQILK